MRQALVLIPAALLAATTAVNAQTIGDRSAVVATQIPARISVGMNISERVTSLSLDEQHRIDQVMRRRLYQMAMEECALLAEVMRAECKLTSLNVNTNFQNNNDNPVVNSSMNGQYEIIPRR